MRADVEETEQTEAPDHPCELMAPAAFTMERCRSYAGSGSSTCWMCPAKPSLKKVSDPLKEYESQDRSTPIIRTITPIKIEGAPMSQPVKKVPCPSKTGICSKCEETKAIIGSTGLCFACKYGQNKNLTKEQVMAKKPSQARRHQWNMPRLLHPQRPPAEATSKPTEPEKTKPPRKYTRQCFFCAETEEAETNFNGVGKIKYNDGEHDRHIYVCHYCASECLQELLTEADPKLLQETLGGFMYKRALDSRA